MMRVNKKGWLIIGLFIFLGIIRVVYLRADPWVLLPPTVAGDEGYWVHHARAKVMGLELAGDQFKEDLIVSPLFLMLQFWVLSIMKISYESIRIVPVGLSLIGLWLFFRFVYRYNGWKKAVLLTLILGSNPLFVAMNRVGLPDVAAFPLLMLALWSWEEKRGYWFLTSVVGLILMKVTNLIILPAFLLLGWVDKVRSKNPRFVKQVLTRGAIIFCLMLVIAFMFREELIFIYVMSSGPEFIPRGIGWIMQSVGEVLVNPFWGRLSIFLISLLAIGGLFSKGRTAVIGRALVIGGMILLFPMANKGSDHRFWHILVGMVLLTGGNLKRTLWWGPLFFLASFSFTKNVSVEMFNLGLGALSPKIVGILAAGITLFLIIFSRKLLWCYLSYVAIGVSVIASLMLTFRPTWSVLDGSKFFSSAKPRQTISGLFSHQLAVPTKLYPVYSLMIYGKDYEVNAGLAREADIRLIPLVVDRMVVGDLGNTSCLINLYPDFYKGTPRVILKVEPPSWCK